MLQSNLEKENNLEFNLNSENFEQNWPILGIVNLDEILPENFQKTIKYWSYMASKVIDTIKNKSNFNSSLSLIQLIQISRTSVLFSLYSYEKGENCLEPITFLSGMAKPSSIPDQIIFPLIQQTKTPEILCNFTSICKYLLKSDFTVEQIINCSIFLSLIELNFYEDYSLFNHFSDIFGCTQQIPENEAQNILNFQNINSLLEALRRTRLKMNQPIYFVLKFMYENLFNYQFNLSYIQDDFYKNLISKGVCNSEIQTIILSCFDYIRGAPIQFEPSKIGKNHLFFCFLCLNSLVEIDDKETFFSKFSIELDPWIFVIYAFYNNIYTNNFVTYFIDFLEIKELNDSWKSALNFILESKSLDLSLDQQNPYFKSIKSLFLIKTQNSEKQAKSNDNLPQIPEKMPDDLIAPILFWYNYNKQPLKVEIIIDLFTKLRAYFEECLQNTVAKHPLFIHVEALELHSNYFPVFIPPLIPTKPEDFLTAPPPLPPTNCYTIINLILSQLVEISIQFKYDIPSDLLAPFYYNYYIAPDIKNKISQLGGDSLNEKANEIGLRHIESIFDAPDSDNDKFECLSLILPNLSILPFAYKFIIRLLKSDDKYIPISAQIFSSTSFLKSINTLNQDEIETMLNCAIDKNLQDIAKLIITNIADTNIVASYISSIAFEKPIIALYLYKNVLLNVNSSQIVSLMSNKASNIEFPKDLTIAVELINFLTILSKSIPHVPFIYQNIIKSKQLPTTWEEDSAIKSNEVLTKAFINIWQFPTMTKDDIANAQQNILSSRNNCLHIHEGCNLCKTVFEKFCCTYHKGEIIQPCFYCYTCGLFDRFSCCLGCAMTCHRGHDLVFVKNDNSRCDCYRMPQMCIFNPNQDNLYSEEELAPPNIEMTLERIHQLIDEGGDISFHQRQFLSALFNNERIQEVHPVPPFLGKDGQNENSDPNVQINKENDPHHRRNSKSSQKSEKSFPVNKKRVLNLFLKAASLKFDKKEESTKDSESQQFDLCWQDIVNTNKLVDIVPIQTNNEENTEKSENLSSSCLIDWNEMKRVFSENDRIPYIMQRCVVSPLNIASITSNGILIISSGKSLVSYRPPSLDKKLSTIEIPGFITQILPSETDPSLIIVSALTQVYVIKVKEEDGSLIIQNDKIITYQKSDSETNITSQQTNNVVLNIFWLKSTKFSVLLRDRMLFYTLEKEKCTLFQSIKAKSTDFFLSASIVEKNDTEFFIVLTLENGLYVIQQISINESKEIVVTEFHQFQWFPEKPIVSYCQSTGLFIVISNDSQIAIIKKNDFLEKNQRRPFIIQSFGIPTNLVFIGNHPKNPNLYIFLHVISGGIFTLQLSKSKVFYSLNESNFDSYRFPYLTKSGTPLSIFKGNLFLEKKKENIEILYSISMDGFLSEIKIHSKLKSKSDSSFLLDSSLKKKKKTMKKPVPAPHLPSSLSSNIRPFRSIRRNGNNNNNNNENGGDVDDIILDENFIQIGNEDDENIEDVDENIDDDNDNDDRNEDPPSRYHDIFIRSLRSMLRDENEGNENDDDGDNDFNEIDPLNLNQQIKVPPFFWSNSRISKDDDIHIFIPSCNKNPRLVLENEKIIFDHSLRKKFIEVSCMSEKEVIIGFSFYVSPNSTSSHRPPYLALNGRVTKVDQSRWYMLPLAADEIEEKKTYRVELGSRGGLDINCDGFSVFVIQKELIEESIRMQLKKMNIKVLKKPKSSRKNDWFFESSSLFSFNDSASSYGIKKSKQNNLTKNENNNTTNTNKNVENENNNTNNKSVENENNNNNNNDDDESSTSATSCRNDNNNDDYDNVNRNLKKFLKQLSFLFSPEPIKRINEKENENKNNNNCSDDDFIDDDDESKSKNVKNEDVSAVDFNNDDVDYDDSLDDESIKELIKLIYTNVNASIPARRILLKIILGNKSSEDKNDNNNNNNCNDDDDEIESDSVLFEKNKKLIKMWADVMKNLLEEKKVLPDLWEVFLRDFSLMPKQEQNKVSDLLWESCPPKGNEFAFFSAFVS